jgi:hypothetical protein
LLGIGDGIFNTQISALLGQLFPGKESVGAFGAYKVCALVAYSSCIHGRNRLTVVFFPVQLVQSLVVGVLFFASQPLTPNGKPDLTAWTGILGGTLLFGMTALQFSYRRLRKQ